MKHPKLPLKHPKFMKIYRNCKKYQQKGRHFETGGEITKSLHIYRSAFEPSMLIPNVIIIGNGVWL